MKILFVNTNIGYGGASKMMAFVANQLAQAKHDITFLTYRNKNVRQQLENNVVHVHFDWENETANSTTVLLKTVARLHSYIKTERFDVAIAFLSPSQMRLSFAAVGTKTKVLLSQRGDPYSYSENKYSLLYMLNQLAFSIADGYVFQTEKAKAYYCRMIQRKSCVIANPIDRPQNGLAWDLNKANNKIVTVGRMDIAQKRQDVLIKAFEKLSELYPEYSLHFYGDGEDSDKIEKMASQNEKIVFHGAVDNVLDHIVDAKIFVMTSDFEGIPNALLEAMSIGLPCISTDCSPGGAAMLIENEVNGILVPRGDIEAVYLAMKKYIQDIDMSVSCGNNAKMVSEKYSIQNISDQWEQYIKKLNG